MDQFGNPISQYAPQYQAAPAQPDNSFYRGTYPFMSGGQPVPQSGQCPVNVPQSPPQIVWVNGIADVNRYNIAPNSAAVFFDSEIDDRYYIKTCDVSGKPTVRVYDSHEVTDKISPSGVDMTNYVTRAELAELTALIKSLSGGMTHAEQAIPAANAVQPAAAGTVQQSNASAVPVQPATVQQPVAAAGYSYTADPAKTFS